VVFASISVRLKGAAIRLPLPVRELMALNREKRASPRARRQAIFLGATEPRAARPSEFPPPGRSHLSPPPWLGEPLHSEVNASSPRRPSTTGSFLSDGLVKVAIAASRVVRALVGGRIGAQYLASLRSRLRDLLAKDQAATCPFASLDDAISARRRNLGWTRFRGSALWSRCHNRFESLGLDH
jgi:hypothetical protein